MTHRRPRPIPTVRRRSWGQIIVRLVLRFSVTFKIRIYTMTLGATEITRKLKLE